jgi:RNA polymerase sigma factor (sigma-70 family)
VSAAGGENIELDDMKQVSPIPIPIAATEDYADDHAESMQTTMEHLSGDLEEDCIVDAACLEKLEKGEDITGPCCDVPSEFIPDEDGVRSRLAQGESARGLKKEEERGLAQMAQRLPALQLVPFELFERFGRTPTAEEWALEALGPSGNASMLLAMLQEAKSAKTVLVCANTGLVVSIAKKYGKYRGSLGSVDDLVQEGFLGLIKALERYDVSKGVRFATYASYYIRGYIQDYVKTHDNGYRVPQNVLRLASKAEVEENALATMLGRDPTPEEVADRIGSSKRKVRYAVDAVANSRVMSIDKVIDSSKKGSIPLGDMLADTEDSVSSLLKDDIAVTLAGVLTEKELKVLSLRYGLIDGNPRLYSECSEAVGIAKETARQICIKALRKIRGTPEGAALVDYLK